MNWNNQAPYWYPNPPIPIGYSMPMRRDDEDMVTYLRRCRREMKELEDEFKSEKKEDKKKPARGLTVLEITGLLFFLGPFVGILDIMLLKYCLNMAQTLLK